MLWKAIGEDLRSNMDLVEVRLRGWLRRLRWGIRSSDVDKEVFRQCRVNKRGTIR